MLPSETAIIALGVATAGSTDPRIALLIAVAAAGALAGDSLSYLIGRRFGPAAERRFFSTRRGQAGRRWAEKSLDPARDAADHRRPVHPRRADGGHPDLRAHRYPYRRFALGTAIAAALWVLYAFFIGRLGGRVFEDSSWAALLLALGVAAVIAAVVEGGPPPARPATGPGHGPTGTRPLTAAGGDEAGGGGDGEHAADDGQRQRGADLGDGVVQAVGPVQRSA